MRIGRRAFILSGLLSVSGLLYWKTRIAVEDIESFVSSYDSIIPIEDVLNVRIQIDRFEKKLLLMISSVGVSKTIVAVDQMIKDEYQSGKVQLLNGWIVSKTELLVLILRSKYV